MAENQDESTRNPQRPQDAPDALDAKSDNAAESTQGTATRVSSSPENLPEPQRAHIEEFIGTAMSMTMGNPIASKVTEQHITDIIASSSRETDHEYSDRKHSRLISVLFVGFAILVLAAVSIVLALLGMTELLIEIIKSLGLIAGGFGGGYGFYAFRNR